MTLFPWLLANGQPTSNMTVTIDGAVFRQIVKAEVTRDLGDISGSFEIELRDAARSLATLPWGSPGPEGAPIKPGAKAEVRVHGVLMLKGWIDAVKTRLSEGGIGVSICGRDVTGDLADCAAAPNGPMEYKNLTVLEFAKRLCKPFKIEARADVDVGKAFDKLTVEGGETVMSAIEKYTRQRGLLVTSDGIGALVLTRSGKTRSPGRIVVPGNAFECQGEFNWADRFSLYLVKGQSKGAGGARRASARLDATAMPLQASPPPASVGPSGGSEGRGVDIVGKATDDEVTRYRPTVIIGRTGLTQKDAQTQAEWKMKVMRAKAERIDPQVKGFLAAPGDPWRTNQLVTVEDRYADLNKDLLIAGVRFVYDAQGESTQLRLCGPEAYDPDPNVKGKSNRGGGRGRRGGSRGGGDATARPLTAGGGG